ncbi:hypothetical protein J8I26_00370 [Herbaspirillum sp. LeCh32-8]|uniref:hypothetical protein n=1 Tax=Herbaspirillum sp. LeCh32-8 TaxID=2821356 RepID=UPI001AE1CA0C|nr:hypothetical protein [Herbaspirillum sp. LeCh32-8]MBP0596547.1 hypothetical protein [Herbaspirillum sp. LeCh32-8]
MQFVAETVPGEITLMFISYLLFCTVLMYLFVKTDNEWGRLEVSLGDAKRDQEAAAASALLFSSAEIAAEPMFTDEAARQLLRHCAEHHDVDCNCFMQAQRKGGE